MTRALDRAAAQARACTLCPDLPLGPRPVLRGSPTARQRIHGQAPGTRVHATGIPWNDPSGDRLRTWLALDRDTFYDTARIAIVPMGLCYPGRLPNGGDAPPRPICAATWHPILLPLMPNIALTLLVGAYAQARLLGPGTVANRVLRFRDFLPRHFPLPHPSWRTTAWERRTPQFAADVLPTLRAMVREAIG